MAQAGVDDVRGSQPPPSIDIIDVSRTVQSTDLFTPYREPRVTLPTIGEFQQSALPFGGKYWGGPLTEYGGVGDLSFRGRQRVRDLEVTRSHRHYRSGFSKYLTDIQPYRLTKLHLSECRLNDQILPAPLQADISRLNWQREHPWPDSRAYGTHHSIFEVFPSVKPELTQTEKEPHHSYRSPNAQPLVKSTQKALLELSRKLYQSTLYQDSFLDYYKLRQNYSTASSLVPRQPGQPQPHPPHNDDISETITSSIPLAKSDFSKKDHQEKEEDEEQTGDVGERLNGDEEEDEEEKEEDIAKGEEDVANNVTTDDTPQTTETTIRHFEIKPNKPMEGIGPCWPPGSSYVIENINGTQMLERTDIVCHSIATPMGEKQQRLMSARRRLSNRYEGIVARSNDKGSSSSLVATLMSQDAILKHKMQHPPNQTQEPTLPAHHITAPLPDTDHDVTKRTALRLPAVQSIQQLDTYPPFLIPTSYHDRPRKLNSLSWSTYCGTDMQTSETTVDKSLGVPGVTWKGKTPLVLPPAPLADCLSSAGTRTPHKLGLRYKSEAHKRYHLMHPDIIPDLRTNLKEGKKYFFGSFHSSVFRG